MNVIKIVWSTTQRRISLTMRYFWRRLKSLMKELMLRLSVKLITLFHDFYNMWIFLYRKKYQMLSISMLGHFVDNV